MAGKTGKVPKGSKRQETNRSSKMESAENESTELSVPKGEQEKNQSKREEGLNKGSNGQKDKASPAYLSASSPSVDSSLGCQDEFSFSSDVVFGAGSDLEEDDATSSDSDAEDMLDDETQHLPLTSKHPPLGQTGLSARNALGTMLRQRHSASHEHEVNINEDLEVDKSVLSQAAYEISQRPYYRAAPGFLAESKFFFHALEYSNTVRCPEGSPVDGAIVVSDQFAAKKQDQATTPNALDRLDRLAQNMESFKWCLPFDVKVCYFAHFSRNPAPAHGEDQSRLCSFFILIDPAQELAAIVTPEFFFHVFRCERATAIAFSSGTISMLSPYIFPLELAPTALQRIRDCFISNIDYTVPTWSGLGGVTLHGWRPHKAKSSELLHGSPCMQGFSGIPPSILQPLRQATPHCDMNPLQPLLGDLVIENRLLEFKSCIISRVEDELEIQCPITFGSSFQRGHLGHPSRQYDLLVLFDTHRNIALCIPRTELPEQMRDVSGFTSQETSRGAALWKIPYSVLSEYIYHLTDRSWASDMLMSIQACGRQNTTKAELDHLLRCSEAVCLASNQQATQRLRHTQDPETTYVSQSHMPRALKQYSTVDDVNSKVSQYTQLSIVRVTETINDECARRGRGFVRLLKLDQQGFATLVFLPSVGWSRTMQMARLNGTGGNAVPFELDHPSIECATTTCVTLVAWDITQRPSADWSDIILSQRPSEGFLSKDNSMACNAHEVLAKQRPFILIGDRSSGSSRTRCEYLTAIPSGEFRLPAVTPKQTEPTLRALLGGYQPGSDYIMTPAQLYDRLQVLCSYTDEPLQWSPTKRLQDKSNYRVTLLTAFQGLVDGHQQAVASKSQKKSSRKHCDPNSRRYPCRDCDRHFRLSKQCRTHEEQVHGRIFTICEPCNKVFDGEEGLSFHMQTQPSHNGGQWRCCFCDERFKGVAGYEGHIRKHLTGPQFICENCESEKLYHLETLMRHNQKMHPGKQLAYRQTSSQTN